ncbi:MULTISPECIES: WD40 domain-containing protein [Calothrix]|uniref:PD40 domain-containing protein n=2 Tax=Calothrix TaxID=1186 RepID=A0ABR8AFL7_9CYAN|nr:MULTISPECIES: PD40 domain-containing protein [Calothrix]MBD2197831.1 PD40 domain-containing protein [Calothrix parietina FACHB-288]MBD2226235.1 PD40 domain-containing protein [Calothrix anomala FACHB-343]
MGFNIIGAVVNFVIPAAEKIISAFIDHKFSKEDKRNLPVKVQEIRQDQRIRQAEIDYYNRREVREKELLQIQELRLKADIQIAAAKAEREERALQLKQEELEDKRKLSALYLDLVREKTAKEIELQQKEIQAIFDQQRWPGVLSRDEAQRIFIDEQKKPRLLMLVPPPDISEDFPISFRDSLNKEIRNQLKIFLEKYYSLQGDLCPVEFYGKYFERSVFDAEIKQLETILSAVPTAIIYTDVTDHEVYFNVRFWGLQEPVSLSFEPWNWEEVKKELEEAGNDEKQSLRVIRQTIVTLHKLLAAFLADWYYLNINPNYEPQLFNIESDIPDEWKSTLIEKLTSIRQQYREIYDNELKALADLPNQKTQICQREVDKDGEFQKIHYPRRKRLDSSSSASSTSPAYTAMGDFFSWKFHKLELQADLQNKKNQIWRCIKTLSGHSHWINSVTISPDGKKLASGSGDGTINLWNLSNGQIITTVNGHSYPVRSVAFSPDGLILASGSNDNTVKLWSSITENAFVSKILTGHSDNVIAVAFSPDGTILASGCADTTIKIWDLKNNQLIYTFYGHKYAVMSVVFSVNGETLISGSIDDTIKIWDLKTKAVIHTIKADSSSVRSVAINPDGKIIASGHFNETVKIWDLQTGNLIHTFTGHINTVSSVAFSPDGKTLASASVDSKIKLWHLGSKELINTLSLHASDIGSIAFSPDGKTIVSGSKDKTIKIWRCE